MHLKVKDNYFQFVNDDTIDYVLDEFWSRNFNKLDDDQFGLILFRVIYEKKEFIMTLGEMQKVNKNDKGKLAELYKNVLKLKMIIIKNNS